MYWFEKVFLKKVSLSQHKNKYNEKSKLLYIRSLLKYLHFLLRFSLSHSSLLLQLSMRWNSKVLLINRTSFHCLLWILSIQLNSNSLNCWWVSSVRPLLGNNHNLKITSSASLYYSDPIWCNFLCILYIKEKCDIVNSVALSWLITETVWYFVWQIYDILVRSGSFRAQKLKVFKTNFIKITLELRD